MTETIRLTLDNDKDSEFYPFQQISVQKQSKHDPWMVIAVQNLTIGMRTWVGDFENERAHGNIVKIELVP